MDECVRKRSCPIAMLVEQVAALPCVLVLAVLLTRGIIVVRGHQGSMDVSREGWEGHEASRSSYVSS